MTGRLGATVTACFAVALAGAANLPAQSIAAAAAREPMTLGSYDGRTMPAEQFRIRVPAKRAGSSRTITVATVRIPSTARTPGRPIVFLMGGPGVPGSVMAPIPPYFTLFQNLREFADVIIVDQRGIGRSEPVADCPADQAPPVDLFTQRERIVGFVRDRIAACAAEIRSTGIDPTAYNTIESADDIDDLRTALGVEQIDLLAFSYGSRLALMYAQRHGDRVGRIVLQGVNGPDLVLKRPAPIGRKLDRISELLRQDTAWPGTADLRAAASAARNRLAGGTVGLMARAVNCAADRSASRWAPVRQESESAPFGNPIGNDFLTDEFCATLGYDPAPVEFAGRVTSSVPLLLLTGSLDATNPLENANDVARGFVNAVSIEITNAAHEALPIPAVQSVIVDWFRGADVRGRAVAAPAPRFAQVEGLEERTGGRADAHVHLSAGQAEHLDSLLANGITVVRDCGGDMAELFRWRSEIAAGVRRGPRIIIAGPTLDGPKPDAQYRVTIRTPAEAEAAVDSLAAAGVDFIKTHNALTPAAFFAVVRRARFHGLKVAAHLPRGVPAWVAADSGVASIEHAAESLVASPIYAGIATDPEAALRWWRSPAGDSALRRMAGTGVTVVPTLVRYEASIQSAPNAELKAARAAFLPELLDLVNRVHRAGIPILVGSDLADLEGAPMPWLGPAREIELLQAAGLSAAAAESAGSAEALLRWLAS